MLMVRNPATIIIINNWRLCVIASLRSAGDFVQSSVVVCTSRMIPFHLTKNTRLHSVQFLIFVYQVDNNKKVTVFSVR
jgi:hypothetical protein